MIELETMQVTFNTIDMLFKQNADSVSLYMFYYKQIKQQQRRYNPNIPDHVYMARATDWFCKEWLKRWDKRFRAAKKILQDMKLMNNKTIRIGNKNQTYIQLNFVWFGNTPKIEHFGLEVPSKESSSFQKTNTQDTTILNTQDTISKDIEQTQDEKDFEVCTTTTDKWVVVQQVDVQKDIARKDRSSQDKKNTVDSVIVSIKDACDKNWIMYCEEKERSFAKHLVSSKFKNDAEKFWYDNPIDFAVRIIDISMDTRYAWKICWPFSLYYEKKYTKVINDYKIKKWLPLSEKEAKNKAYEAEDMKIFSDFLISKYWVDWKSEKSRVDEYLYLRDKINSKHWKKTL